MSNRVIGKTIAKMMIAADKKALLFVTTDGEELVARADGDCCSQSWVESVELPALGFPFTVSAIEDLDLGKIDEWHDGECISFYGCKVVTDKGDMVIDYRNESNGYYGGNLSWPDDDYFYGGVYEQNVSTGEWVDIKDAG